MCLRLRPRVWDTKAIPYLFKKTLNLPKHISDLTIFVTFVVKPSRARRTFVFLLKDNRILKRSFFFANTGSIPRCLDTQIPRYLVPDSQIPTYPDTQISRYPDT